MIRPSWLTIAGVFPRSHTKSMWPSVQRALIERTGGVESIRYIGASPPITAASHTSPSVDGFGPFAVEKTIAGSHVRYFEYGFASSFDTKSLGHPVSQSQLGETCHKLMGPPK